MLKENLGRVGQQIASVCQKIGRDPHEVTLVGVTKYTSIAKIKEAIAAGLTHIGENRVQDALNKFVEINAANLKVTKHLIGHLQTNKVKQAIQYFDLIQSVDGLKLAAEISQQAAKSNRTVDILVQVNPSQEMRKSGVELGQALFLIEGILKLPHVKILGLMTMAPLTENEDTIRGCFRSLRELRDKVIKKFQGSQHFEMKYLSMGMSGDYKIALEEGSNMVRIGRAIFGED